MNPVLPVTGSAHDNDDADAHQQDRSAPCERPGAVITCDVAALDICDLAVVDVLMRLLIVARRSGSSIQLRQPSQRLATLIHLCGLDRYLPRRKKPHEVRSQA